MMRKKIKLFLPLLGVVAIVPLIATSCSDTSTIVDDSDKDKTIPSTPLNPSTTLYEIGDVVQVVQSGKYSTNNQRIVPGTIVKITDTTIDIQLKQSGIETIPKSTIISIKLIKKANE